MARATLLYDEDCGFCRWSLFKLLAWDRRNNLRPVPLQSEEADRLLDGMSVDRKMASWHLVSADGSVHSAGAAVPPLLRLLPAGGPLASAFATFPGATERLYRWVADHRDRLGRLVGPEACAVDPSKIRTRQP